MNWKTLVSTMLALLMIGLPASIPGAAAEADVPTEYLTMGGTGDQVQSRRVADGWTCSDPVLTGDGAYESRCRPLFLPNVFVCRQVGASATYTYPGTVTVTSKCPNVSVTLSASCSAGITVPPPTVFVTCTASVNGWTTTTEAICRATTGPGPWSASCSATVG